jgi:hypothetical protein
MSDNQESRINTMLLLWEAYEKAAVPGSAGKTQRNETKRAFYAGATAIIRILFTITAIEYVEQDGDILDIADANKERISGLLAELSNYMENEQP